MDCVPSCWTAQNARRMRQRVGSRLSASLSRATRRLRAKRSAQKRSAQNDTGERAPNPATSTNNHFLAKRSAPNHESLNWLPRTMEPPPLHRLDRDGGAIARSDVFCCRGDAQLPVPGLPVALEQKQSCDERRGGGDGGGGERLHRSHARKRPFSAALASLPSQKPTAEGESRPWVSTLALRLALHPSSSMKTLPVITRQLSL